MTSKLNRCKCIIKQERIFYQKRERSLKNCILIFLEEFTGFAVFESNVLVSPYSWYHVCLGLDTVSGLLQIIMNGHVIQNEEKEFFRGTDSIRPKSLAGKLGGKIESYQSLGTECCAILHLIPTNQFSTFKLNELCFSFQNIHNWFLVHE